MVEQRPVKALVVGSNPTPGASERKESTPRKGYFLFRGCEREKALLTPGALT